MIRVRFFLNVSDEDNLLSFSALNSICLTVLNGGSSFVTERFFENSGFSFEIIGANKKTKRIRERTTWRIKEIFPLYERFCGRT